ncbi:MAG: Gfo/Idh/MocA family protein [Janthinobacterium lividum]
MSAPIRIGIIGVGKIAKDQHVPALAGNPGFTVVGAVTRHEPPAGVQAFADLDAMVAGVGGLDAVTICTPPVGRHVLVRAALNHGLHVMLEKPPGASLSELADLPALAAERKVALFASWHTREAPAVAPARAWLKDKHIGSVTIDWREDVRRWHPGQAWIWEPGGLGVFDPGSNALSAATAILPSPLLVTAADLSFPANRATPIAVALKMTDLLGTPVTATFDWRETGVQVWNIAVETDAGPLLMSQGGGLLDIGGQRVGTGPAAEYPGLYRHFAELVAARSVEFDLSPFRLIADACTLGRRIEVAAFDDPG